LYKEEEREEILWGEIREEEGREGRREGARRRMDG
jgi:hypothetical protein